MDFTKEKVKESMRTRFETRLSDILDDTVVFNEYYDKLEQNLLDF